MQTFIVILLSLPAALSFNCTDQPDGNYEISCRSYSKCDKGVFKSIICQKDNVYSDKTKACDDPLNVGPPCGKQEDCTQKKDGHYADTGNGCHSYYTCASGYYLGHNLCPRVTVFDESMQTCNWPHDVAPPCGTLVNTSP